MEEEEKWEEVEQEEEKWEEVEKKMVAILFGCALHWNSLVSFVFI